MTNIANLLTEHIAIWTAADTEKKSGRGRASGNAGSVYGVKKLRELILELAVRGKLVPQEPNDEPANELLKRIQAEKAKLIAEGKLKKDKLLAPIGVDEKPFELPKGWEYSKLGNIATKLTDGSHNPPRDSGFGIPMLSSQNVNYGFIDFDKPSRYVTEDEFLAENSRTKIEVGDVLLTIVGTLGRAAVVQPDSPKFVLQRSVATIKTGLLPKYLCLQFGSPFCSNYFEENGKGTAQKGIYLGQLADMLITVPPLSEQHRIVAKVDELMALCDQLEQQHSNAQEAHEALVSLLLATLTQSQNAAEFNANWQRIYAHFDVLFTTEASIDALKQTLLQLAVMGKLVPQDHNDEPASELLKRIQAEKAKLIAEGKLKKEKPLAPIADDEKPFELPKGWDWVRLSQISSVLTGNAFSSEDFNEVEGAKTVKITNAGVHEFIETKDYLPKQFIDKYPDFLIKTGDLVLAQTRPYISDGLKISICPQSYDNSLLNQRVVSIRPISEIFNLYIYTYMRTPEVLNFYMNKFSNSGLQPNLKITDVTDLLIALPPIYEQHRIVAKVDALMALCDQLKTRIQQANQQQQVIADALVAQALKPATAEIVDLAAYRAAITCNIIKRMQHNHSFGRTFAMKLLYLSQQHIGFETYLEFEREAAGPFDKWIYDFERDGVAAGWFGLIEKQLSSGYIKIEYQLKSSVDEPLAFMNRVGSREQRNELDRLFTLFADKKTEDAEIAATLFAAWNDFLLNGISPTDEQIIQEVRENWHSSKERFSPEQLTKWLNWLRDNNIVPTGKGCKTIYQQKLIQ